METIISACISSRGSSNKPIIPYYLDYAVKAAMCDGKGAAWTEDEQVAARKRMGVKEVLVAQRGVTKFAEIEEAYNSGKQVVCTDGWLITKLDILAPDNYAQFSGLDDNGNPALLKVTKDNNWTRINVTKATTDYVNSEINKVNATIAKQKTFVAEYGTTTYEELLNAYEAGKIIILRIPKGKITDTINKEETFLPLSYVEGNNDTRNFVFTTANNQQILHCMVATDSVWKYYVNDLNVLNLKIAGLENSVGSIGQYINGKDPLLSALGSMNTVDILKSVYSFRGGFCNNAGTLHIKNPGIYLIIAGGTGNKQIIINQNGTEALNETWNGIIILAYEGGVITPIGIATSLAIAGTFKMPGTFQGWTSDGSYSTTINYPSMCVVAYLGNSDVNYLE